MGLGVVLFRVLILMIIMIVICLALGRMHVARLLPLDFMSAIMVAVVAGMAVAGSGISLAAAVVAIIEICILYIIGSYFTGIRSPVVLVKNGNVFKRNLAKVRMSVRTLLGLLRGYGIFDIRQVDVAILECNGNVSVLKNKKADSHHNLIPVIIEGKVQVEQLKQLGFSPEEIQDFAIRNQNDIKDIFIAFMDHEHNLHVIKGDCSEECFYE